MISLRKANRPSIYGLLFKRQYCREAKPILGFDIHEEGIAVLTMQRRPVNCFNSELMGDIADALEAVESNKCKGAILTSAIPSIFSAGMDIKEMYKPDVDRLAKLWHATRRVTSQLLNSGYVTAAAITGHTSAGSCILSLLTEYRVMVDGKATITMNDTAVDIVPPQWVLEVMAHVMGRRRAEIAANASVVYLPQEAMMAGLIDDIASNNEEAIEKCKQFIRRFDNIPQLARTKTKKLIRKDIIDIWNEENQLNRLDDYIRTVTSPERQKALELYLEGLKKRK